MLEQNRDVISGPSTIRPLQSARDTARTDHPTLLPARIPRRARDSQQRDSLPHDAHYKPRPSVHQFSSVFEVLPDAHAVVPASCVRVDELQSPCFEIRLQELKDFLRVSSMVKI